MICAFHAFVPSVDPKKVYCKNCNESRVKCTNCGSGHTDCYHEEDFKGELVMAYECRACGAKFCYSQPRRQMAAHAAGVSQP